MSVDRASYERLLQYKIPEVEHTLSKRDTMLYALGVGLGGDPVDERQLRFVYEKDLLALPSMAVVLSAPHAWIRKSGTGFASKSVHGEQHSQSISRCQSKASSSGYRTSPAWSTKAPTKAC
jgi:hypothetical protein